MRWQQPLGTQRTCWRYVYLLMLTLFDTFWWKLICGEVIFWTCCQNHASSSDSSTLTQVDVYLPDAPKLDPSKSCACWSADCIIYIYIVLYIHIYANYIWRGGEMYVFIVLVWFCYFKIIKYYCVKKNVEDVFGLTWYWWEIDSYHDHWAWNRQGLPFRSLSD